MNAAWNFVKMAEKNNSYPVKMLCPCRDCRNLSHQTIEAIYEHLVIEGMDPTYTIWFHHGEQQTIDGKQKEETMSNTYNLFSAGYMEDGDVEPLEERRNVEFKESLDDAKVPLYPGCTKYTKLSAIVALYKHKAVNGWSNKSFDGLLEMLHDMLPTDNVLPRSVYLVRKFLKAFDLGYEKIHACVNDCCLFRKENEEMDCCPKYGSSRWKVDRRCNKIKKGVLAKVLRYFPVIPRFRRMFRSQKLAEDLRWHFTHKSEAGKIRRPVDSLAWDFIIISLC